MAVNLDELINACEMFGIIDYEVLAYVSRTTGEVLVYSEEFDDEPLPEDIDDETKYVAIPDRYELDLGNQVVFDFVSEYLPEHYDRVRSYFSAPGAYARFKDLLDLMDKLDEWRAYEEQRKREALTAWCRRQSLEIEA